MKAKQNLEILSPFETLIISSPNCTDSLVLSIKNGNLLIGSFYEKNLSEESLDNSLKGLPCIYRKIEFTGKMYVLTSEGVSNPTLFRIEEMAHNLKISPLKRKFQNEDSLTR